MKSANKWNFLSISKDRKNKINSTVRTERCKLFALEYLLYKKIRSLPMDFTSDSFYNIFKNFEWIVIDFDEAKNLLNNEDPLNIKKRKALARTFHKRNSKTFLTVYTKNKLYPAQDYYTIAHELGHIILGHFIEFENTSLCRGGLTQPEYYVLEREAEIFAAEFIMPMPVLKKFKLKSNEDIINLCQVSKSSSIRRFNEWQSYKLDDSLTNLFNETQLLFNDFIFKKKCLNCGYGLISKTTKYCPICGQIKLVWGDRNMIYKGIELDEKGRAKICPQCENEEIQNNNSTFCEICGTNLYNRCTNSSCGTILAGNARYCGQCGSPSTFFKNNFLKLWSEEKMDDELPF